MASPVPLRNHRVPWRQICSLIFAGLSLIFLYRQFTEWQRVSGAWAAIQEENRRGTEQLAHVKQTVVANLKESDRLTALMAVQAKPARPTAREDARAAGRLFLADHPEAKELVRISMLNLAQGWPAREGRAAGFSDEQIKQWTEIFARQKGAPFFLVEGVDPEFGDLDSSDVQGKTLKEIVGDALYAHYEERRATSYGRHVTAELANRAEALGSPFTSEQVQALAAIFGTGNLNKVSEWERAAKELGGLLSPEQRAVFDEEASVRRAFDDQSKYEGKFLSQRK